jgi:P-type Cu2+ transporter
MNPVTQAASVTYDPTLTSVREPAEWVRDCGYHCQGRSVPGHVCDPMAEPESDPDGLAPADQGQAEVAVAPLAEAEHALPAGHGSG